MTKLDRGVLIGALQELDRLLEKKLKLLVGGGGALILAHALPLATYDIDAIPFQSDMSLSELDQLVKKVAQKLSIPKDWLNPYFSSFTYVLPTDYRTRLKPIYQGHLLEAVGLGAEDLFILKCFAGRPKDVVHAKYLLKKIKDLHFVEAHLEFCVKQNLPRAEAALDFFDEIRGER